MVAWAGEPARYLAAADTMAPRDESIHRCASRVRREVRRKRGTELRRVRASAIPWLRVARLRSARIGDLIGIEARDCRLRSWT